VWKEVLMARKFSELKAKMSQQAQARLEAKAKALLDEMSSTDQPEQESQAQKRHLRESPSA